MRESEMERRQEETGGKKQRRKGKNDEQEIEGKIGISSRTI